MWQGIPQPKGAPGVSGITSPLVGVGEEALRLRLHTVGKHPLRPTAVPGIFGGTEQPLRDTKASSTGMCRSLRAERDRHPGRPWLPLDGSPGAGAGNAWPACARLINFHLVLPQVDFPPPLPGLQAGLGAISSPADVRTGAGCCAEAGGMKPTLPLLGDRLLLSRCLLGWEQPLASMLGFGASACQGEILLGVTGRGWKSPLGCRGDRRGQGLHGGGGGSSAG